MEEHRPSKPKVGDSTSSGSTKEIEMKIDTNILTDSEPIEEIFSRGQGVKPSDFHSEVASSNLVGRT